MDNAAINPKGNNRGIFGSFIAEIVEGLTSPKDHIKSQPYDNGRHLSHFLIFEGQNQRKLKLLTFLMISPSQ